MSEETRRSSERSERKELPIERGFPIERVNEIAEKESRAKPHYRPIYTMHKWWARRLGSVFRSICLYSLLDNPSKVDIYEPGQRNGTLSQFGGGHSAIDELVERVDISNADSLWELYTKDVRVKDKRILDPFMGGGTSLVEASRFDASVVGNDLNPVAWFVTKKQLEAGETEIGKLQEAFEKVESEVKNELKEYYRTSCPHGNHDADVMYYFWVKELDCLSCGENISLFKDYRVAKGRYGDEGYYVFCPDCEEIFLTDDWRSEDTCPNGHKFVPEEGNVSRGGNHSCPSCGQKYPITDSIQEQGGFRRRLYSLEYYCEICDEKGLERSDYKGFKPITSDDKRLFREAKEALESDDTLQEYIPSEKVPKGAKTTSSSVDGSDVFEHGYTHWKDFYNSRQLLCLSKILSSIDKIEDQNAREYLMLAFSDSLMFQNTFSIYNRQRFNIEGIFKSNSLDPQMDYVENNVWGTEYGRGTFKKTWQKLLKGIEYASAPTDRYIVDGSSEETEPFEHPIGGDWELTIGDSRKLDYENEFDAVITDPPYYDNIIYSELSDFFYVWQKIILKDHYDHFTEERTPHSESIVANPAEGKGVPEFESEIKQAFAMMEKALVEDGVLVFTYHHSDSESWGELLGALCDVGFEITATYPVDADINKLMKGETVSFDIIVVGRPAGEREPTSWNSLRRQIYRTAQETHKRLEENRDLSQGDIGVIEMGECFHEYSKHHGKVMRAGEEMTAKEVVQEIYGVIQQGSKIGVIDVFLDLLESPDATYDDLNKLTRGTDANPDQMEDMRLYRRENGEFILGRWDDEKRMAYIQERVNGDDEALNALDKAQFLRYRYEQGKSTQNYLSKWDIDDELRELCEGLADATGDDTYRRILGADSTLGDF